MSARPALSLGQMPFGQGVKGEDEFIQRMCAECEEEEEEKQLHRKEKSADKPKMTSGAESQINSLRGKGSPLPPSARSFFEPRFGHKFNDVRIHTG